jgi:uncharacterized protein (DUF885 family)
MRYFVVLCLFVLAPPAHGQAAPQSPNAFFKDTFEAMLRNDPEYATSAGRHEYDDRWTDWSKAARDQRRQFFEQRLAQLATAPIGDSAEDLLTKRVVRYDFESRLEAWDVEMHLIRVGQLFGFHNAAYLVIDGMPARNIHDYENIIARLRAIPTYIDQNIGILDESIASAMMQPRVVADLVIQQIDAQIKHDAEQTELLKAFRSFPAGISPAEQQRLRRAAQDAYNQQFLPAWRKLHDYMVASYLPHVRAAVSISSMPGGRSAYTILIHRLTTTTMSAGDIHTLGEQEVARIEAAMLAVMKDSGFTGFHFRVSEEDG